MPNSLVSYLLNASLKVRRLVSAGILASVALLVLVAVASLFETVRNDLLTIEENRRRLGGFEAMIAAGDQFVATRRGDSEKDEGLFFEGVSEAVIKAAIQSWLEEQSSLANIEVNAVSDLPTKTTDETPMVGLRASLYGTFENVQSLLVKIENNTPAIFISKIVLNSGYNAGGNMDGPVFVNASLELFVAGRLTGREG